MQCFKDKVAGVHGLGVVVVVVFLIGFKIKLEKEYLPLKVRSLCPQHFETSVGGIDENLASAKSKEKKSPWDGEISLLAKLLFLLLDMRWLHLPLEVPSAENSG